MTFTPQELRIITSALFLAAHFREETAKDVSRELRDRKQAEFDVTQWRNLRSKILEEIGPARGSLWRPTQPRLRKSFDERMASYRKAAIEKAKEEQVKKTPCNSCNG